MNKSLNKGKKLALFILLVMIIVTIIVVVVVNIKNEPNSNESVLEQLKLGLTEYNESQDEDKNQIIIQAHESDIVLAMNNLIYEDDGTKHTSTINYTTKKISTMMYNKDNSLLMIVNMSIDEQYNVLQVLTYTHATGDIQSYQDGDAGMERFRNVANKSVALFKEALEDTNIYLYGKTLEDIK